MRPSPTPRLVGRLGLLTLAVMLLAACGPAASPGSGSAAPSAASQPAASQPVSAPAPAGAAAGAAPGAPADWDEPSRPPGEEGRVVISAPANTIWREQLTGFQKEYPGD